MTKRLLIADDEPLIREVLMRAVSNLDCNVDSACDGTSAWALIANIGDKYDLIFMDMQMPGHTGKDLLSMADSILTSKKVVVISGMIAEDVEINSEQYERRFIEYHPCVKHILNKPFDIHDIRCIIKDEF